MHNIADKRTAIFSRCLDNKSGFVSLVKDIFCQANDNSISFDGWLTNEDRAHRSECW